MSTWEWGLTPLIRKPEYLQRTASTITGLVYIDEKHAAALENVEILKGDVLLNITGDSVARVCQVDPEILPARVNQHVAIIRPDPEKETRPIPRTFSFLLNYRPSSCHGQELWWNSEPPLLRGMIESLEVLAPADVSEQRAIAHILGTLDDKIEMNRRMNETLEAMARALFKSWFIDFDPVRAKAEGRDPGLLKEISDLFPNSFVDSELGEIPKGWTVVQRPEIIDVNPSRSLSKGEVAPYLDMANMPIRGHAPDVVIDRPFGSGMRFINGDTLVARITPCLENGKTAYVDFLKEGQVAGGSTEYIVMCPKPSIPEEFAYCLARSEGFREFAIQSMTGSSGRQRVPVETLSHYLLVSPPNQVAKRFGSFVRPRRARKCSDARGPHSHYPARHTASKAYFW